LPVAPSHALSVTPTRADVDLKPLRITTDHDTAILNANAYTFHNTSSADYLRSFEGDIIRHVTENSKPLADGEPPPTDAGTSPLCTGGRGRVGRCSGSVPLTPCFLA